jgi:exodeoxyribonuclease VII large subunit
LSVSQVTQTLRLLIESEGGLQNIWVQGELSNFSRPKSGHWYFTLKDDGAQLPCVMWRSTTELQVRVPQEGESLEVHGGLNVYEAGGRYQLYVDEIRSAGEGALYREFLRLKAKLEAEGLFAMERKRPIPTAVRRIGIITSPTGAALRDILNTLARRFPIAEVYLVPCIVQGPGAPFQLSAALRRLNFYAKPDLILLARGGGSLEDLAAFNSEMLARAIVASQAPVISGVGHETDFSIADFAADLRAPTPTAAAELATPDRAELAAMLRDLQFALARGLSNTLREQRWSLQNLSQRLHQSSPGTQILTDRQRLDDLTVRAGRAVRHQTRFLRSSLAGTQAKLSALGPTAVLERGYAVVSKPDGSVVSRTAQTQSGESLDIRVSDGTVAVRVEP